MTTSTTCQFLVAYSFATDEAGLNRFKKVGIVAKKSRLACDAEVKEYFSKLPGRNYENVLKACKWLESEVAAKSVDIPLVLGGRTTTTLLRVQKLG